MVTIADRQLRENYQNTNEKNQSGGYPEYEEGVFTPTLYGSTDAGTTTYAVQFGKYTRIGRMIFAQFGLAWSGITGVGQARTGGLPYSAADGLENRGTINLHYYHSLSMPDGSTLQGFVENRKNYIRYTNKQASTQSQLTDMTNLSNTGEIYGMAIYSIS